MCNERTEQTGGLLTFIIDMEQGSEGCRFRNERTGFSWVLAHARVRS